MKVIVFGASGGLGINLVKELINNDHDVTAFVRTKSKLGELESKINNIIIGSAESEEDVSNAIKGHDAVLSAVGGPKLLIMNKNIISQVDNSDISRIILTGGLGALGIPDSDGYLIEKLSSFLPDFIVNITNETHIPSYEALLASSLNFSFLCPPSMKEAEKTGKVNVRAEYKPEGGSSVTYADVASVAVSALESSEYDRKRIGIAASE